MNCSEEHRRIILSWVEVAEDDLKVAHRESNLPAEERSERAICFHSQQSVEKLFSILFIYRIIEQTFIRIIPQRTPIKVKCSFL